MFCRLGSAELSRPVAAIVWKYVVWMRPSGATVFCSPSTVCRSRVTVACRRAGAGGGGRGPVEEGLQRLGVGGVAGLDALGFGRSRSSNSTTCSCLGEPRFNCLPMTSCACSAAAHAIGELGMRARRGGRCRRRSLRLHAAQDVRRAAARRRAADVSDACATSSARGRPRGRAGVRQLVGDLRAPVVSKRSGRSRRRRTGHAMQVAIREVGEVRHAMMRTDQVGSQRGVGYDAGQRPALSRECVGLALGVVEHLGPVGVRQPVGEDLVVVGRELFNRDPGRSTRGRGQGEVLGTRTHRSRDADDLRDPRDQLWRPATRQALLARPASASRSAAASGVADSSPPPR